MHKPPAGGLSHAGVAAVTRAQTDAGNLLRLLSSLHPDALRALPEMLDQVVDDPRVEPGRHQGIGHHVRKAG